MKKFVFLIFVIIFIFMCVVYYYSIKSDEVVVIEDSLVMN